MRRGARANASTFGGRRAPAYGGRRAPDASALYPKPKAERVAYSCGWCDGVAPLSARRAVASLDEWAGGEPPCDWCGAYPEHAWCQGFGGRRCENRVKRCTVAQTQLQLHCASVYGDAAVDRGTCAARCAHAATNARRECAEEWVAGHVSAAAAAAESCGSRVDAFFGAEATTVVVFTHLQKTGGWSVVDFARRAGVRCPRRVASKAAGARAPRAEVRAACEGFRPLTPQDERLLRGPPPFP